MSHRARLDALLYELQVSDDPATVVRAGGEALTLLSQDSEPAATRALIQGKLADGARRVDEAGIEGAIDALRQALDVDTRDGWPREWSQAQLALGECHRRRTRGDRATHRDLAIAAYDEALTGSLTPAELADAHYVVAKLHLDRVADRDRALDAAIEHLTAALHGYREPRARSAILQRLGDALSERARDASLELGERAIACYEEALTLRSVETSPKAWAETMMALGIAYHSLAGDRATNIDAGLAVFERVVTSLSLDEHPGEIAAAEHAVGLAYCARITGDRAANVERGIDSLTAALEHTDRDRSPRNWAMTRHALGAACDYRLDGDRSENLARAREHFEQALEVERGHAGAAEQAGTLTSLGLLCARAEQRSDIDAGIAYVNEALMLRTGAADRDVWAHSKGVLALLYERRAELATRPPYVGAQPLPRTATADDLEHARTHLEEAAAVLGDASSPHRLAVCRAALGYIYQRRVVGLRTANLRKAAEHYRRSLGWLAADPRRYIGGVARLGEVCAQLGEWEEAAEAFELATTAADRSYAAALTLLGRDDVLRSTRVVSTWAAYALARAGRPHDAIVALERGRARALGDSLGRDLAELDTVRGSDPNAFAAYRDASTRLRQVELAERDSGISPVAQAAATSRTARDLAALADAAERAGADLAGAIERIRGIEGCERFLEQPDARTIGAAAEPRAPIAYLACTPWGSLTLLARPSGAWGILVDALWDEFTHDDLAHLLFHAEGADAPTAGFLTLQLGSHTYTCEQTGETASVFGPMSDKDLGLLADAMAAIDERAPYEGIRTWRPSRSPSTYDGGISVLAQRLIEPLARRLHDVGADGVTLVACGLLGLLPAHTARYGEGDDARCLIDDFAASYAPSARVVGLARASLRAAPPRVPMLAGVGNPLPHPNPLEFAALELEQVARCFGHRRLLYGEDATKDALFEAAAAGASHVHLACHGMYRLGDPAPHLELAGEDRLTPEDITIQRSFATTRLVVMSACQTAIIGSRGMPDEVVGLPSAVMAAGVPGVIGTLWPVDDLSTTLLMERFYALHLRGDAARGEGPMQPARALRLAQLWLANVTAAELRELFEGDESPGAADADVTVRARYPADVAAEQAEDFRFEDPASKPFANVYYWGPFVFVGV